MFFFLMEAASESLGVCKVISVRRKDVTSCVCLMPACLFLRRYKFVRNPSLSGGETALRGSFLAHSLLCFETKLPQSTFSLPDLLPVVLAQTEASTATWQQCDLPEQGSHLQRHTFSPQPVGIFQ